MYGSPVKIFQAGRQAVNDVRTSADALGEDLRRVVVAQVLLVALVAVVALVALLRTVGRA